jgi:hypothetical protein
LAYEVRLAEATAPQGVRHSLLRLAHYHVIIFDQHGGLVQADKIVFAPERPNEGGRARVYL